MPNAPRRSADRPSRRLNVERLEDRATPTASLVADIYTGADGSNPSFLTAAGSNLFFAADDDTNGRELNISDGTSGGTKLVFDIPTSGEPSFLTNVGGTVFFAANDGTNGIELWKSDGTAAGTKLVRDIITGGASSSPNNLTAVGGTLFFTADDGTNGVELWQSDGTESGTKLVKDIRVGADPSVPANLTNVGGMLYFTAFDDTNGEELWRSDGSEAGTKLVRDIYVGATGASPTGLTDIGGVLYFAASDEFNGRELYKSDGTEAGTVLIRNIATGAGASNPAHLTNVGGVLYFAANDDTGNAGLWRSNGTTGGTKVVRDFASGGPLGPTELEAVGGTVYFAALDPSGATGFELWKSDGTAAGTVLVKDVNADGNSSFPVGLTNVNGTLFFAADDGVNGVELWRSDGTASGTVIDRDILEGTGSSNPAHLTAVGGTLFFAADDGVNGVELWKAVPPPVSPPPPPPPAAIPVDGRTLTVQRNGNNVEVLDGSTVLRSQALSSTDPIVFTGTAAKNDTVAFVTSGGPFSLPAGSRFDGGAGGTDSITFTGNADATVTASALTSGDDTLLPAFTGVEAVFLSGEEGNNKFDASAFGGPVSLVGGAGNDTLIGGSGDDTLNGGSGSDSIVGGAGTDLFNATLTGVITLSDTSLVSSETDTLTSIEQARINGGNLGSELFNVSGWTQAATLSGGGGTDRVTSSRNGNATLTNTSLARTGLPTIALSSIEQATLIGGTGADRLDASAFTGPVSLVGGSGNDTLVGGSGNDTLFGGSGNDSIAGGAGTDRLDANVSGEVSLTPTSLTSAAGTSNSATDTLSAIDLVSLTGSSGDDIFTVSVWTLAATLNGGSGLDLVASSRDGDATLTNTSLARTGLPTIILAGIENGFLAGGAGNNKLDATAFSGTVVLAGNAGLDTLLGGSGNDTLSGGPGNDSINGGGGTDRLEVSIAGIAVLRNVSLVANAATDTLTSIEQASLTGGSGDDVFDVSGWTLAATLNGGGGTDRVTSSRDGNATLTNTSLARTGLPTIVLSSIERATLIGGSGADRLDASAFTGPVSLVGGGGNDTLTGGSGDDTLDGGLGNDSIAGGSGTDRLVASVAGEVVLVHGSLRSTGFTTTPEVDTNSGIDQASLIGSTAEDTFDVTNWAYPATLDGGLGNDRVVSARNENVTLNNTSLTRVGLSTVALASIERATLIGLSGNNVLNAGAFDGGAVLMGGGGNDTLIGGAGRDILIGGTGNDSVFGFGGDDIVIAGRTTHDATPTALAALHREWVRTDATYAVRRDHLLGVAGGSLAGSVRLKLTTSTPATVFNDGTGRDTAIGGVGVDWFFTANTDTITDLNNDGAETRTVLPN